MLTFRHLYDGLKQLDPTPILNCGAVDTNGKPLPMEALSLVWARAVDEGYSDPKKVVEDFDLQSNPNLSVIAVVSRKDLESDFADMKRTLTDFDYESADDYVESFSWYFVLPSTGDYVLWLE